MMIYKTFGEVVLIFEIAATLASQKAECLLWRIVDRTKIKGTYKKSDAKVEVQSVSSSVWSPGPQSKILKSS